MIALWKASRVKKWSKLYMELQGFTMKFLNKIYHNEIKGGREFVEKSSSFLSKKRNGLSEDGHSITSSDFNE